MEDCIFCKIVKGEIPCFTIYDDAKVLAFADINPINTGHTLVIPKIHAENIWEIEEDELAAVHRASRRIAGAMKTALQSDGIAFLQLNGRAVNQLVMHYHLHLIPRKADDPALPMTEWAMVPGDMKVIEETARKIAAAC